jgi:hypothetical protein
MWLELLKTKDEAFVMFKKIKVAAELESGCQLKAFRTDCGGEFNSGIFVTFCRENGIKHNTTTPYSPQQNGVVEHRNQSVVEKVRCLLKSMNIPRKFWGEAVQIDVYLLNRAPTKSLDDKTPFEAWFGRRPGVKHLRVFGCIAYAKKLRPSLTKLADRAIPGIFLGYEIGAKGYKIYDPTKDRLMVSRDVVFDERKAWNWGERDDGAGKGSDQAAVPYTFDIQCDDIVPGPTINLEPEPVSSTDLAGPGGNPASPASSIPSHGGLGDVETPPHTPVSATTGSSGTGYPFQWATPPTNGSMVRQYTLNLNPYCLLIWLA